MYSLWSLRWEVTTVWCGYKRKEIAARGFVIIFMGRMSIGGLHFRLLRVYVQSFIRRDAHSLTHASPCHGTHLHTIHFWRPKLFFNRIELISVYRGYFEYMSCRVAHSHCLAYELNTIPFRSCSVWWLSSVQQLNSVTFHLLLYIICECGIKLFSLYLSYSLIDINIYKKEHNV